MSSDQDLESARGLLTAEDEVVDWDQRVAELKREARESPVPAGDDAVDQLVFSQTIFNAKQDAHGLCLKVFRLGPADRACVVELIADKGSLTPTDFAGGLNRHILFDVSEREKVVQIGMRENFMWEGIRMCPISLSVVQSVREAQVEERGGKAIIIVSDTDKYPENEEPPTLVAFLKSQRRSRGNKLWKSLACLAYLGIQSVIEAMILKIVVDTAVKDDAAFENGAQHPRDRRQERFYFCALAYFVSYCVYYYASLVFKENRGFGGTKKWLRDKLFSKFLQLSEGGVSELSNGQFLDTAIFQVEELTKYGWEQSLGMWQSCIVIIANLMFQLYLLTNKMPLSTAVPFCLVVPTLITLVMVAGFYARDAQKQSMIRARQDAEDEWMEFAQEAVSSRQLVARYHVTEAALGNFRSTYNRFWKANREASTYQMHTQFIPNWFFALGLVCVYASVPFLVRLFAFGAGDIAALVKSWVKLNGGCNKAYSSALNMARATASLEKISDSLNRTDRVSERVEHSVRVLKDNTLPMPGVPTSMEDLDVVRFEKVSFQYEEGSQIFERVDAEIQCHEGGLWLLVCPAGADASDVPVGRGRRTLLRMMGNTMCPTAGRLTLPSFRRIVYVDRSAVILNNSVLRNLSFGRMGGLELDKQADARAAAKGLKDDETQRDVKLRELCRWTAQAMGMSKRFYENLDKNIGGAGLDSLTTMDATGLVLARAFLSEAEMVLVDHVGDGLGDRFMDQLHRYASGGLRLVLQEAGIGCPDTVLPPPPQVKPLVVWSPLHAPQSALARAAGTVEINEHRQLSVRRRE